MYLIREEIETLIERYRTLEASATTEKERAYYSGRVSYYTKLLTKATLL